MLRLVTVCRPAKAFKFYSGHPDVCSAIYIYISSRSFENIPQNGPEYSYRNLALARFLVTVVRKNIGGLLSWLVSLSSSVTIANSPWVGNGPPLGGGCCKSVILSVSLVLGESVHWSCLPLVCHVKFF